MHTRIRKFNTRDTYPEQKLDNDLCQTVVARGSMVFVRGQVGQDLDTAVNVGIGDAAALLARADVPAVMVAAFERQSEALGAVADIAAIAPSDAAGSSSPGVRPRFATQRTHFVAVLLRALCAGVEAGGEAGPIHSAGLLVVRDVSWPIVDLRIDWADDDPVAKLAALWERYEPQVEDYVRRALDPAAAPGFGVPGDS